MNFSFLKDPYFPDEFYLKKPTRVEVLGYIFLLALLVYKVFQRRIRQHVTEENSLIGAGKRKTSFGASKKTGNRQLFVLNDLSKIEAFTWGGRNVRNIFLK